jgi:hypothetical protein
VLHAVNSSTPFDFVDGDGTNGDNVDVALAGAGTANVYFDNVANQIVDINFDTTCNSTTNLTVTVNASGFAGDGSDADGIAVIQYLSADTSVNASGIPNGTANSVTGLGTISITGDLIGGWDNNQKADTVFLPTAAELDVHAGVIPAHNPGGVSSDGGTLDGGDLYGGNVVADDDYEAIRYWNGLAADANITVQGLLYAEADDGGWAVRIYKDTLGTINAGELEGGLYMGKDDYVGGSTHNYLAESDVNINGFFQPDDGDTVYVEYDFYGYVGGSIDLIVADGTFNGNTINVADYFYGMDGGHTDTFIAMASNWESVHFWNPHDKVGTFTDVTINFAMDGYGELEGVITNIPYPVERGHYAIDRCTTEAMTITIHSNGGDLSGDTDVSASGSSDPDWLREGLGFLSGGDLTLNVDLGNHLPADLDALGHVQYWGYFNCDVVAFGNLNVTIGGSSPGAWNIASCDESPLFFIADGELFTQEMLSLTHYGDPVFFVDAPKGPTGYTGSFDDNSLTFNAEIQGSVAEYSNDGNVQFGNDWEHDPEVSNYDNALKEGNNISGGMTISIISDATPDMAANDNGGDFEGGWAVSGADMNFTFHGIGVIGQGDYYDTEIYAFHNLNVDVHVSNTDDATFKAGDTQWNDGMSANVGDLTGEVFVQNNANNLYLYATNIDLDTFYIGGDVSGSGSEFWAENDFLSDLTVGGTFQSDSSIGAGHNIEGTINVGAVEGHGDFYGCISAGNAMNGDFNIDGDFAGFMTIGQGGFNGYMTVGDDLFDGGDSPDGKVGVVFPVDHGFINVEGDFNSLIVGDNMYNSLDAAAQNFIEIEVGGNFGHFELGGAMLAGESAIDTTAVHAANFDFVSIGANLYCDVDSSVTTTDFVPLPTVMEEFTEIVAGNPFKSANPSGEIGELWVYGKIDPLSYDYFGTQLDAIRGFVDEAHFLTDLSSQVGTQMLIDNDSDGVSEGNLMIKATGGNVTVWGFLSGIDNNMVSSIDKIFVTRVVEGTEANHMNYTGNLSLFVDASVQLDINHILALKDARLLAGGADGIYGLGVTQDLYLDISHWRATDMRDIVLHNVDVNDIEVTGSMRRIIGQGVNLHDITIGDPNMVNDVILFKPVGNVQTISIDGSIDGDIIIAGTLAKNIEAGSIDGSIAIGGNAHKIISHGYFGADVEVNGNLKGLFAHKSTGTFDGVVTVGGRLGKMELSGMTFDGFVSCGDLGGIDVMGGPKNWDVFRDKIGDTTYAENDGGGSVFVDDRIGTSKFR